ncbi:hypothetical protein VN97_g9532 [Penicillium thymicola]|uniref:Uncharacterized protein n=1 Tax=Penicillium thymicola TaxID=293382 RepID=A0AAI9X547_PENTH|nr:hypothetical protein VN97_g9532 [Penicillium thymicola]
MSTHNDLNTGAEFLFIPIKNPNDRTTRLARSHAVAHGLRNKRKLQQSSGHNFHVVCPANNKSQPASKAKQDKALIVSPVSLAVGFSDPLQMMAAESPILRVLLKEKFQQPTEPDFSVADELVLQNFRSVLRKGLDDNALLSAVMLTFLFTVTAGMSSRVCLEYQNKALSSIRQRMSSPDKAATESTIGAILLLAGIEVRLGMPRQVQLHMEAIQQILDVCQRKRVYLSDDIKRAIFWSDLNGSVTTGSSRVVDHTTFSELQWRRDPSQLNFFILPPGFQSRSYLLGQDFVEILKDVCALQCIRDTEILDEEEAMPMAHIDNHQASIQSRLVSLPVCSPISECCHQAAYLCSTMLRCKIWRTSTIPSHLSLQLLCKIQSAINSPVWDDSLDLLAWLLHIGGAFAPTGSTREGYLQLLHLNHSRLRWLYTSWPELLLILKQFIWSDKAFLSQVKAFWEENSL